MVEKYLFLKRNYFQMLLEKFLCVVLSYLTFLEGCRGSYVYPRKKLESHGISIRKYRQKHASHRKKTVQNAFPSDHCSDVPKQIRNFERVTFLVEQSDVEMSTYNFLWVWSNQWEMWM